MGQATSSKPQIGTLEIDCEKTEIDFQTPCQHYEEEIQSNPNADPSLIEKISVIMKQNGDHENRYLNFPFFTDQHSVTYIYDSKVIFLMKGLSGSGKSTIAKHLNDLYKNSVVLSADDFMIENNRYVFDKAKLGNAHNNCKQRAVASVQSQIPVIVIDNTNVCSWEMKFYVELAKRFNYVVIAMEPRTPWKFDAEQLGSRNSHGVPCSIIRDKLKIYQDIQPIYYGWFLNDIDSIFLLHIGKSWLERCWKLAEFSFDFHTSAANTSEEFLSYFSHGNAQLCKDRLLHCTSRFTSRWEDIDEKYHNNANVQLSIGKVYLLRIIGFVITESTFAARVSLIEDQLKIWGEDKNVQQPVVLESSSHRGQLSDELVELKNQPPPCKRQKTAKGYFGPPKSKMDVVLPTNDLQRKDISTRPTMRVVSSNLCAPLTSGMGSKAHITLGVSRGVSPVTAGFDLEDIVRLEQLEKKDGFIPKNYKIPGANITNFGNRCWAVYLEKIIICESIFSHFL